MKRSFRYEAELSEKFTQLSGEIIQELSDFVESKVLVNLDISNMESGKVYLVSIDTGMMPGPKAEKCLQESAKVIKSAFESAGKEAPTIMTIGKSSVISSPTVFELVAGKTYLINIDTGMIPYPKSLNYLNGIRDMYDAFVKSGCTLHFMMKNKLIYSFKELEDTIVAQSIRGF